jgi:ribosome-binding factor A
MKHGRLPRINSLLKEVLSEVIRRDFKNSKLTDLLTVTDVETTSDLRHAKVHISVIGDEAKKNETMAILSHAKGYIAVLASKKVKLRYFPELHFKLDEGVEKQMRIEQLLQNMHEKGELPESVEDEDAESDSQEDSEEDEEGVTAFEDDEEDVESENPS